MEGKILNATEARCLGTKGRWALLGPFLRRYGTQALAYATLQEGMEYFVTDCGYIAFTSVQHPLLAPRPRWITFSDPVCPRDRLRDVITAFLSANHRVAFGVISEECAAILRQIGFKANCLGFEPEIPIQTYNTQGDWKELDLIKRARNEARREGLLIREEDIETVNRDELDAVSAAWRGTKKVNDREIWLYARRPLFVREEGVRKFVAYDRDGHVAGFVFYDPIYQNEQVIGYAANISRCDELRFGRLATAIHMEAIEVFRREGAQTLNLCLAPFVKLDGGRFNDDPVSKKFFELSARYGNNIYNFQGLSFHKSKYRGQEKFLYYASNSLIPTNDIYLAFRCADITRSFFVAIGQLLWGMIAARKQIYRG